jgi:hypothetical protein
MTTAWFAETIAWLPGTLFGVVGGVFGACVGCVLPFEEKRRKWLKWVKRTYWALVFCSAGFLVLGVVALVAHQPYSVWYALALPGSIGVVTLGLGFSLLKLRPSPTSEKSA